MSQRVTLDHPELGGRVRTNTSSDVHEATRRTYHRPVVASAMSSRATLARQQVTTFESHRAKPTVSTSFQKSSGPATPLASERSLEHTVSYADEFNSRRPFIPKWKSNSVYAMAIMLFVFGMFVAIYGFVSTTRANDQIEVLGDMVRSGNPDDIQRVAQSIPNEDDLSDYDISNYQVAPDMPRYIRIPSISVPTTRVLETGLNANGEVGTPEGIYDTSWYNGSAKLTDELGAMFIVGHYVGPHKAGVFFNLEDVKTGNIIEVEHGDGNLSHFRIIEKTDYPVDKVDMDKALSPVDPDRLGLNLMTCAGNWDASLGQYNRRTLVRAEKI